MAEQTEVEKLQAQVAALNEKYKAFEDAHRDQVRAAIRAYWQSLTTNPVAHCVTAIAGALALKFAPVVAKWVF